MKALDLFCGLKSLTPILQEYKLPFQSSRDDWGKVSSKFQVYSFQLEPKHRFEERSDVGQSLYPHHKPHTSSEFQDIYGRNDQSESLFHASYYIYSVFRGLFDGIFYVIKLRIVEHIPPNNAVDLNAFYREHRTLFHRIGIYGEDITELLFYYISCSYIVLSKLFESDTMPQILFHRNHISLKQVFLNDSSYLYNMNLVLFNHIGGE